MTTIYLAGRYQRRDELRDRAADLRSLGIDCDPAWLREPHDWDGESPEGARRLAEDDWRDLTAADAVLAFTDGPGTTRRGGRHLAVERSAVIAAARRFLEAHDRVIATRDDTFTMKNRADELRDVFALHDENLAKIGAARLADKETTP